MVTTLSLTEAVILVLDTFAIVRVLVGTSGVMRGALWIAVIVLLPVLGMVLYFLIGRSAADAQVVLMTAPSR